MAFDYARNFKELDFRAHPELYQIGVGEQGVLLVEPYKSEILPHWRFATPGAARASSEAIYGLFLRYGEAGDFVGMDMARKFLQMGMTRARRYANHRSGHKYDGPVPMDKKGQSGAHGRAVLPMKLIPSRPSRRRYSAPSGWKRRRTRSISGSKERHQDLYGK